MRYQRDGKRGLASGIISAKRSSVPATARSEPGPAGEVRGLLRRVVVVPIVECLLLAGLVVGCARKEAAEEAPVPAGTPAPAATMASGQGPVQTRPVTVEAYIDKSDEAQSRTVEVLQSLGTAYKDMLTLQTHDISDGADGTKAYREAGLHAETIRVDGSEFVEFDRNGTKVTVAFTSPAGFRWTYQDLIDAVGAASRGQATPLTEEEARGRIESRKLDLPVDVAETRESGKRLVALRIGDAEVFRLAGGGGTGSALKRALQAKKVLEAAFDNGFVPSDISARRTGQSWAVLAKGRTVVVLTGQDAKALGGEPGKLADNATAGIREAVEAAVLPTESEMPLVTGPSGAATMGPT